MRMRRWSPSELLRRKAVVLDHVARYSYVCPGWGVAPHRPHDLTADHVIPRYEGGECGPLRVLCRGCDNRRRYRRGALCASGESGHHQPADAVGWHGLPTFGDLPTFSDAPRPPLEGRPDL